MVGLAARRRLPAEKRKEAIQAAAKGVFGARGYHEATMREIAAAAGVSEALLYQHFDGKRQLFEALVMDAAAQLEADVFNPGAGEDPLAAGVAAYFDFVERESNLYRVFFRQALHAEPAIEALYRRLIDHFMTLLEARFHDYPGTPPHAEVDVAARAVHGLLNELALWWVEEGRHSRDEIVRRAVRMTRAIYQSEVGHGPADPR